MNFTRSLSYVWVAIIALLEKTLLNRGRIRGTLGNHGEIGIKE